MSHSISIALGLATLISGQSIWIPTAAATETVVKVCKTTVPNFTGDSEEQQFSNLELTIVHNGKGLIARAKYESGQVLEEPATLEALPVRPGLKGIDEDAEIENVNTAEALVSHAMTLTQSAPEIFQVGFDLSEVRMAQVYRIGTPEANSIGMTAVVEAYDGEAKPLGSFFGGFMANACK